MTRTLLIAGRELRSFLYSPTYWLTVAIAWLFAGAMMRLNALPRSGGELSFMLVDATGLILWVQLLFVPLLTMRLLSEEKRSGTFEMLVTAPVRDHEIVLGKFFAAALLNAVTWTILPLWFLLMQRLGGNPDMGVVWSAWLSLAIAGAVFVSVGLFASSITQHQVLAGFLGVIMILGLMVLPMVKYPEWMAGVGEFIQSGSISGRVHEGAIGILDGVNILYQMALAAMFLLYTTRVLEARKWS